MKKIDLKQKYEILDKLFSNMNEDHIGEFSAQCSYYTILSFIPFIMLVITLIQYTGVEPQTLFDVISKIIPSSMSEMILGIVQEVYSKSIGTISISVIFTIWAAGKGLYALTKGLQIVYNTDDKEETSYLYTRVKAVIETIVFIVLIVMGLTLLVFGNGIISIIKEKFGTLENYNLISSIATEIGLIFVTFIVFILLYKLSFFLVKQINLKSYNLTFLLLVLSTLFSIFCKALSTLLLLLKSISMELLIDLILLTNSSRVYLE